MHVNCDVSCIEDLRQPDAMVRDQFGGTDVLTNNADIQPGIELLGPRENRERVLVKGAECCSPSS
jgi:hypothetical protein